MGEFFGTLFSDWSNWDAGQWLLVVAILVALGVDGKSGWKALKWARRGFRSAPETVQHVRVVLDETAENAFTYPKITPPSKDRILVGRETELVQMRSILASRHGVQITGQKGVALKAEGGRGKTSLAREYAERYGPGYDGGCWVRAESRLNLLTDLAALGNAAFDMPVPDPVSEAHGKAVLQRITGTDARWLLVYDNIDDHADIKALMCTASNVDVIVTTRLALGWDGFGRIDVEVLDFSTPEGGAVDLLLQEAGMRNASSDQRAEARLVAEQLGGLPLALVMGGALVREEKWSLSKLRAEMEQVLSVVPENGDYPDSVAGAVMLTYDRLPPDAQVMADLCAWLAPEGLSEDLFLSAVSDPRWGRVGRKDATEQVQGVLEDKARLRDALRGLQRWSVLSCPDRSDMHRLTQTVLRARQQQDGRAQEMGFAASAILAAQFQFDPNLVVNWPACRNLLPHVQALWATAEPLWRERWDQPDWAAMGYLLNLSGLFLSKQQDLSGAIVLGRAALELNEARLGEDHRDVPLALGNLALDLANTGALGEAEDMIAQAVRLDAQYRKGPEREDLAARYIQQASVAFRRMQAGGDADTGAVAVAETALAQARSIRTELFGAESLPMAHYWNETGFMRGLQGRKWDALDANKRAYEITKSFSEADQAELAMCAKNFGATALELGQSEQALGVLHEAYDLAATVYAEVPNHGTFTTIQGWLVSCLLVLDRKGVAGMRAKTEEICARHNLNVAEIEARASTLPLEPVPRDPPEATT